MSHIKDFESWLNGASVYADEFENAPADVAARETGEALVRFYREIVRIATSDEGHWGDVAELFSASGIRELEE